MNPCWQQRRQSSANWEAWRLAAVVPKESAQIVRTSARRSTYVIGTSAVIAFYSYSIQSCQIGIVRGDVKVILNQKHTTEENANRTFSNVAERVR